MFLNHAICCRSHSFIRFSAPDRWSRAVGPWRSAPASSPVHGHHPFLSWPGTPSGSKWSLGSMVMMVKCTCGVEPPFNQSHLSNKIYIPAASKDPCYDLEAMLSKGMPWYAIAASLSQTKKSQQDTVVTMLIAPFLGEMVGGLEGSHSDTP